MDKNEDRDRATLSYQQALWKGIGNLCWLALQDAGNLVCNTKNGDGRNEKELDLGIPDFVS